MSDIVVGNVIGNTLSNPRATADIFGSAFRSVMTSFYDDVHGAEIIRRISVDAVQAVAQAPVPIKAILRAMETVTSTVGNYVANQTLNQRNAIVVAALIPFGIYLGVGSLKAQGAGKIAEEASNRVIDAISTKEQIAIIVKQQIIAHKERTAPVVLSFTAAQLTIGTGVFFGIAGMAYIYYRQKQMAQKIEGQSLLGNKLGPSKNI